MCTVQIRSADNNENRTKDSIDEEGAKEMGTESFDMDKAEIEEIETMAD